MVLTPPSSSSSKTTKVKTLKVTSSSFSNKPSFISAPSEQASSSRKRRYYQRKRPIPETERQLKTLQVKRQEQYERVVASSAEVTLTITTPAPTAAAATMTTENANGTSIATTTTTVPAVGSGTTASTMSSTDSGSSASKGNFFWSFESLFPAPVWDEETIKKDLFGVRNRDRETTESSKERVHRMRSSQAPSLMRLWRQQRQEEETSSTSSSSTYQPNNVPNGEPKIFGLLSSSFRRRNNTTSSVSAGNPQLPTSNVVDRGLTRMVQDRLNGYRRDSQGSLFYDISLLSADKAVQFRNGVRLGNALKVNADRLNYLAKRELQHGRVEEAVELLELAMQIDPRDGRAYLGLSRCAQRRRDFALAREYLKAGIANSIVPSLDDATVSSSGSAGTSTSASTGTSTDAGVEPRQKQKQQRGNNSGPNPYLTQALGCLEEQAGQLSQAEALYVSSVKSRPCHAAAWVALGQLRTSKLGQPVSAGRACFQSAERELKKAGLPPSAHVYTAWASLEYHMAGDARRARELFKAAIAIDPKCSAAWVQLGVMEADKENWNQAQQCFETVLKFDQRNSRCLQAYALMETKRPDGSSRKAIDLLERALQANPRDAGVYQAYALYVAELGDIDAARSLLQRGTQVDKRHAPVWQAWGVLETRHGTAAAARNIFQQGIWACAQLTGNQSGGYRCARLWQAWGVLEAREGDHAAARRCFSRALDADQRNVPAVTAWALMEENLGNVQDARFIFERTLPSFAAGSEAKVSLWRTYELMEQRLGNLTLAQQVYQRCMREAMAVSDEPIPKYEDIESEQGNAEEPQKVNNQNEIEVIRWDGGAGGEVWLNDRAIEAKVPFNMKKRRTRSTK